MRSIIIMTAVVAFACLGCQNNQQEAWKPLDLLEYGIPLTVMAPDSTEVNKMNLGGILQDVTLKNGEDYYIQIYASDATTNDIAKLKAEQLSEVKTNKFFTRVVSEEEDGFIYETKIDTTNFGFRYIYLQADREYIFQTGLTGTYSLEEVERMMEAVKQGK